MSKEIEGKTATVWSDLGFELGKEGKFQEAIEYFFYFLLFYIGS